MSNYLFIISHTCWVIELNFPQLLKIYLYLLAIYMVFCLVNLFRAIHQRLLDDGSFFSPSIFSAANEMNYKIRKEKADL